MKNFRHFRICFASSIALVFVCAKTAHCDDALTKPAAPTYLHDVLPILMGKCARCHGADRGVLPDWMDYQTAFNDRLEIKRRVWQSWNGAYYKQPMPAGNSQEALTITESERRIIKRWVDEGAPRGLPPAGNGSLSKAEKSGAGKQLFGIVCAVCHQPAGQGIASRFPPLVGSDFLNANKHRAIKIVINGLQGELVVNGQKFNSAMPKFPLSDQDIANVLTYVYNSMGNSGQEVTADEVSAARAEAANPSLTGHAPAATVSQEKSPFE
jgi:mono/diheme cytochrome c family protein